MSNTIHQLSIDGVDIASYRSTVLYFLATGANDNDTLSSTEALVNGWVASLQNLWLGTLPSSYNITQLRARRSAFKPSYVAHKKYNVGNLPGTRSGSSTSQQLNPVLFLVPTMGTKSGGKIFWPSI